LAGYAEERAQIENLQARYLFALDFKDHDLYVTTFTPDGILDVGNGPVVGRQPMAELNNCRSSRLLVRATLGRRAEC
jgi:hypothetical protein